MRNIKGNVTNELIYKTETDSQTKKTMYGYQKGTEGSVN